MRIMTPVTELLSMIVPVFLEIKENDHWGTRLPFSNSTRHRDGSDFDHENFNSWVNWNYMWLVNYMQLKQSVIDQEKNDFI